MNFHRPAAHHRDPDLLNPQPRRVVKSVLDDDERAGWAVRILYYYSLRTSFRACLARSQTCPQARGHQEESGKERGEEERKKEEAKKEERGERESRTVRNELIFDRFRAPRSIGASIWIESASKNRCCAANEKVEASQQKIVRSPKIAMRRF